MGKSVLEHVFHNHARPLGHGQQRQHLYLHIRREAGIRLRLQLCKRCQTLRRSQNNAFFFLAHVAAHFAQLRIHRQQRLNRGASQLNGAACNCPCRQQRSGDNAVGHGRPSRAVQVLHALNRHNRAARAADASAHCIDEVRQIDDFRFTRRVVDNGNSRQQHRRHQDILRRADAGVVQMHLAAVHIAAVAVNHAAFLVNHHAQTAQA